MLRRYTNTSNTVLPLTQSYDNGSMKMKVVTKEDVDKAYDAAFAAWNKYIKLKREFEDGNYKKS